MKSRQSHPISFAPTFLFFFFGFQLIFQRITSVFTQFNRKWMFMEAVPSSRCAAFFPPRTRKRWIIRFDFQYFDLRVNILKSKKTLIHTSLRVCSFLWFSDSNYCIQRALFATVNWEKKMIRISMLTLYNSNIASFLLTMRSTFEHFATWLSCQQDISILFPIWYL